MSDQRLYLPKNYKIYLDTVVKSSTSLFDDSADINDFITFLDDLILKSKVKEVDPEESLFTKIVSGDSGDNIISVARIKAGVYDDNANGIGESGAETIYKIYKELGKRNNSLENDIFS